MKDRVGSYVKGTLIITIKDGKLGASDVQILKKIKLRKMYIKMRI
jgi:hypothetical protein